MVKNASTSAAGDVDVQMGDAQAPTKTDAEMKGPDASEEAVSEGEGMNKKGQAIWIPDEDEGYLRAEVRDGEKKVVVLIDAKTGKPTGDGEFAIKDDKLWEQCKLRGTSVLCLADHHGISYGIDHPYLFKSFTTCQGLPESLKVNRC